MGQYSRREFVKTAALGAVGVGLAGALSRRRLCAQETPRKPNIVLIIADDQGWGDYGFMGHPAIKTPNLDRMASQSVVFTRGYVTAPVCLPSLASILTGLHPHQSKITGMCVDPPAALVRKKQPPPADWQEKHDLMVFTFLQQPPKLPEMLNAQGYVSLQTGKWWHGHFRTGGFTQGMTLGDPKGGGRHGDAGLTIGRETMQPIYDFIETNAGKPFFLWYAPMMPHNPHNPPDRLFAKYQGQSDSLEIAKYWAMCEWFDETCGQLLDYLDRKGLADNTLVFYFCDNGWIQSPDKKIFAERSKNSPYEGGVRTPLMVRWPARVKPRRDEETPVSAVDIAPTILAAVGLAPTPQMHGVNLLDEEALAKREAVFGAVYLGGEKFGGLNAIDDIEHPSRSLHYRWVVKGKWKLIVAHPLAKERGAVDDFQLFDLQADPWEKHNLVAQHPDLVQELNALVKRWWTAPPKDAT